MLEYLGSEIPNQSMVEILRDLPVWPNAGAVSDSQRKDVAYVSAADGYFCSHDSMLMPWLDGLDRFVDPRMSRMTGQLNRLNITWMSVDRAWMHVAKNYPETLPNAVSPYQYGELIKLIARHGLRPAESIAMDGDKKM